MKAIFCKLALLLENESTCSQYITKPNYLAMVYPRLSTEYSTEVCHFENGNCFQNAMLHTASILTLMEMNYFSVKISMHFAGSYGILETVLSVLDGKSTSSL